MYPENQKNPPYATILLLVAFLVLTIFLYVQVFQELSQGLSPIFGFIPALGLSRGLLPWLSSIFYHSGIFHILSNGIPLLVFGIPLEKELGKKCYLILFLGSGLVGNITLFLFKHRSTHSHIGSSAAVMGIIVYFICSTIHENKQLRGGAGIDIWIVLATLIFVFPNVVGFSSEIAGIPTAVSNLAHLGGAIGGFLFFDLVFKPNKRHMVPTLRK